MKNKAIKEFFAEYPNDDVCLNHIMESRYGMQGECCKCHKQTRYSRVKSKTAFACQWCGHHVYPCVGTPFENSRTSLQSWFYAIYLFTTTRHGVPAKELERQLGVTYKCAWRMGHEIRKHMSDVNGNDKLKGIVQVDETYVGGEQQGKRGRGSENKTIVFAMLETGGDIIAEVVSDVKKATLQPIIEANVEKSSEIHSDELRSYKGLDQKGYEHETVNHSAGQYADLATGCHVNGVENFWSHLKKAISGTHVHVSKEYLENYVQSLNTGLTIVLILVRCLMSF